MATHFGAIVGAFIYKFVIENHWPSEEEIDEEAKQEEIIEMNRLPDSSVIAVETEEEGEEKKVKKHRKKKKHHHHDKEERKDKKL